MYRMHNDTYPLNKDKWWPAILPDRGYNQQHVRRQLDRTEVVELVPGMTRDELSIWQESRE
jgi:hypothetical protein